ncbi:DUF3889 domain-containing protein [Paenibacillus sp. ISL-20]|uniref:DUF3889 domain-containing protein n=1 Tax=Paenibacillus sp. ISL-20 TaxID=2819163 RepID=UPI001BEC62AF|nr:DUF3889 domain-containing protein [Paenibacillus sp. ISL-20]MBT2763544.1 DUF3889 domain-containing protein [Paenibacillus sp. ISL-20]
MLGSIVLVGVLSLGISPGNDQGIKKHQDPYDQQAIFESGGELVEEAMRDCEEHFGTSVFLPPLLPPVAFTHQYGRCYDMEGGLDEHLEVHYQNRYKPEHSYKIELYPLENKQHLKHLSFEESQLSDHTTAKFYKGPINTLRLLVFEKGDWQYLLTAANRASSEIRQQELTEIAESLVHALNSKDPVYATWGTLAVTETKRKYNMDVVDYLYMGRTTISNEMVEEKFKLWLKKGAREFGVYVTVAFHPTIHQFISIRYEEF